MTAAELAKRQEEEQQRLQQEAEVAKKRQSRIADEEEYEKMVLVSNTNRDDSIIEAHSVDDALTKMTITEPVLAPDRHPERRLKATFKVKHFLPGSCFRCLIFVVRVDGDQITI